MAMAAADDDVFRIPPPPVLPNILRRDFECVGPRLTKLAGTFLLALARLVRGECCGPIMPHMDPAVLEEMLLQGLRFLLYDEVFLYPVDSLECIRAAVAQVSIIPDFYVCPDHESGLPLVGRYFASNFGRKMRVGCEDCAGYCRGLRPELGAEPWMHAVDDGAAVLWKACKADKCDCMCVLFSPTSAEMLLQGRPLANISAIELVAVGNFSVTVDATLPDGDKCSCIAFNMYGRVVLWVSPMGVSKGVSRTDEKATTVHWESGRVREMSDLQQCTTCVYIRLMTQNFSVVEVVSVEYF